MAVNEIIKGLLNISVVCGAQRDQRHFVVPCCLQNLAGQSLYPLRRPFPYRPVDHACLAESATARTTPEDLHHGPVVDNINVWDDRTDGVVGLIQVYHQVLVHPLGNPFYQWLYRLYSPVGQVFHLVEGGNIQAWESTPSQSRQVVSPALLPTVPGPVMVNNPFQEPFSLSQHYEVEELGDGLRVVGAGPTAHYQRIFGAAVRAPQGNARQVKQIEDVGEAHLVLQGKAQQVVATHLCLAFKSKEGNPLITHDCLHINPRRKNALTGHILDTV